MEISMKNLEIINSISFGSNSLLDTKLEEIVIRKNDREELKIELTFSNFRRESNYQTIKLIFDNVFQYHFYHNQNYIFYNVESFKLLNLENGVYLSLDPDESTDKKSKDDLDFIQAESLQLIEVR
jgi:hypothetical protein